MNDLPQAVVLAGVAAIGVVSLVFGGVLALRCRRGPAQVTLLDGFAGLVCMMWYSGAFAVVAMRAATGQWMPDLGDPPLGPAIAGTALGTLTATAFVLARGTREELGLVPAPRRDVVLAFALVPVVLAVSAAWVLALEALGVEVADQQVVDLMRDNLDNPLGWFAIFYGLLMAPVLEELFFRGFLVPPLVRRGGPLLAIAGTAVLFGALHGADPQAVVPLVFLGALLAWLRVRSGSLLPSVVLHVANNLVALGAVLLGVE